MKKISEVLLLVLFLSLSMILVGCKDKKTTAKTKITTTYIDKQIEDEDSYEKVIYVSDYNGNDSNEGTFDKPVKTIAEAKNRVKSLNSNMNKDIAIVIREGYYQLSSTLKFDESDSGSNGHKVIYKGYPDEKVEISAGIRLNNWKKEGDLYYTELTASFVRDMYVNGQRATLARNPNTIDLANMYEWNNQTKSAISYADDLKGATKFEAVFYMEWSESIARVKSVDIDGKYAKLNFEKEEDEMFFSRSYSLPQIKNDLYVYYQNAKEFLDNPGEFYYDRDSFKLYYYPKPGEDMNDIDIVIPNLSKAVNILGGSEYVHDIAFENLVFEHNSDSTVYSQGFSEIQSAHYYKRSSGQTFSDILNAAVVVEKAHDIDFKACIFRHTGNGGLLFYQYDYDSNVIGNLFTDTAAYGVTVAPDSNYHSKSRLYAPVDEEIICHHINISNNYFYNTATVYTRSATIASMHGYNITIEHNEVAYCSYTGISVGWGWSENEYNAKNNVIRYNDVHHYGFYGSDLGGIYTLNNQPGLLIEENYIHECENTMQAFSTMSCYAAIYLDEGTNNGIVRNNQIRYCGERTQTVLYHVAGNNIVDEGNKGVLYGDTLDETIVNNAGVEPSYKNMAPYVESPEKIGVLYSALGTKVSNSTDIFGMRIDVLKEFKVKGLGRLYSRGNYQVHTIYIYNSDKKVIAQLDVDMSKGTQDYKGYKYAYFDKPVALTPGQYYIVSQEYASGDIVSMGNTYLYGNSEYLNVLGIVKGQKLTSVKTQNTGFVGINLVIE